MAKAAVKGKPRERTASDPAAILGLIAVTGMLLAAIFLGGTPAAFIDLPSVLIVIGGTLALTVASFPMADLAHAPRSVARALSPRGVGSARRVALEGLAIAELARREDLRHVETQTGALANRPILRRGVEMILDGTRIEQVRSALQREVAIHDERRVRAEGILRRAADVAPAMGLIGTLIGLVQMLGQLDDPSAIGPGMAVALLTTFYGAMLAHAILTPLAERLSRMGDSEHLQHEIQFLCVMSIAERENPRRLETLLNGLLPPSEQLEEFA